MNRIKSFIVGLGRSTRVLLLALAVMVAGAGIVQAATTISTNISTAGTLAVTGLSSLGQASSTMLSVNSVYFGATATTTISSTGALSVAGLATFLAGASTTQFTLLSGDTIKNTVASTTVISGNLTTSTTTVTGLTATGNTTLASTTATTMKVGQVGTGMTRIVSGYCVTGSITIPATNASSTQAYADCTPSSGASVITSGDRVFLQATSSLPYYVVIQAASSTVSGLINVGLTNFSTSTSPAAAIYAFNFWAFQ